MIPSEELSYLDHLVLLNHTQQLEILPYDVLKTPELRDRWLKLDAGVRKRLLLLWCGHYRAIAWWMRLHLLETYQLLSENEFEAFINVRVEADFATARFFWAQSVYPLIPLAQEYSSVEEFCYALEVSDFIKWIELAGVMGTPALNESHRLLGKAEGLKLDITALKAFKNEFKLAESGDLCPIVLEHIEGELYSEPTLTEALLANALQLVSKSEGGDNALASVCMDLLEAKLKLQRTVMKKDNAERHVAYYAASPHQLFITQKGVKTPRPNFQPKRGRGRPPKSSSVKKN
jgi:hypothetical protein